MAKSAPAPGGKKKAATKNAILGHVSEETSLTKKQVESVLESLAKLILVELSKKGPGLFTLPGLVRLKRAEKAATPKKMGRNPRTGEQMEIPAKPKRTVVRAYAVKALKEMVATK